MMKFFQKIKSKCNSVFNNKVDALGLAVFRILYAVVLFCEISQLYKFRHIIYDKNPFVTVGEIDVTFLFFFWFLILGLIMIGLFTRIALTLNYIFGVIIFSSANYYEYHIFYIYVTVNFLLLFIPVSRVFSLDCLIKKIKYSEIGHEYKIDRMVLEINYMILVFAGIALVYFDSIFLKLSSPLWLNGLGMWLPASLPMVVWNDTSIILNQEFLIKFLGYFVIVFEGLFIFLFWIKGLKVPLMIIGILFHIGIFIIYPIPWFALTFISLYLLLLPEKYWKGISNLFKSKSPTFSIYYDLGSPLHNKLVIVVKHMDLFNKILFLPVQKITRMKASLKDITEKELLMKVHGVSRAEKVFVGYEVYVQLLIHLIYTIPIAVLMMLPGISILSKKLYCQISKRKLKGVIYNESIEKKYLFKKAKTKLVLTRLSKENITIFFWKTIITVFFFCQCLVIWTTPLIQSRISKNNSIDQIVHLIYYRTKFITKKYLGVMRHTVFLNEHFYNYTHIYKVTCLNKINEEILVPIVDNKGMPAKYISGPTWRDYAFGISYSMFEFQTNKKNLEKGLISYLNYFIKDEKIRENNLMFKLYVKDIDKPRTWEKDFLRKQIKKPWHEAGLCKIENGQVNYYWNKKMDSVFNNIR